MQGKVSYSFQYRQYILVADQPRYFPRHRILRLFTSAGNFDLRFDDPMLANSWYIIIILILILVPGVFSLRRDRDETMSELWDHVFSYDEVDNREDAAKVRSFI